MRDRLIELMRQAEFAYLDFSKMYPCEKSLTDFTADYLFEKGVIVPPCKLGDTVWVISKGVITEHKVEKIDIVADGKMYLFYHWRGSGYEIKSIGEIGKTVFLTPEDAEAEIKRRERE